MGCVLTAGIAKTCDNLPVGGLRSDAVWLLNFDDIASYTEASGVVSAITMKTGKVAYKFDGFNFSTKPAARKVDGRGAGTTFEHEMGMEIFDLTTTGKDIVQELAAGKVVAIVETNEDSESFEIYGKGVGLSLSTAENIKADAATGGSYTILLKTDENGPAERKLPTGLHDTDRATTLALVVALES